MRFAIVNSSHNKFMHMKPVDVLLRHQFLKQFWTFMLIFFLIGLGVILEALLPFTYKMLIDNVLGKQPLILLHYSFSSPQALSVFVISVFFIINILMSLTDYAHLYTTRIVIQNDIYAFSRLVFLNLEAYDIGFFRKIDIGDYLYRLTSDVDSIGDLMVNLISIATSVLFLLISTIIMFLINVKLTLISFITLPFLLVSLIIFNKKALRTTKHSEFANSTLYTFMQQALKHLKNIQAYSQELLMSQEFNKKEKESLNAARKLEKVNYAYDLVVGVAIAIIYSTIFAYGVQDVFMGQLTIGFLVVFIYYLDNLTNPMISLANSIYDFKQAYTRISRLDEFFTTKSHLKDTGIITKIPHNNVKFNNVTLIGEENFVILNNISCDIPINKITIIAGISGSGKSSFISLIPRLIEKPTSGEILLGNIDITMYPLSVLRNNIAFVSQENELFNYSIQDIILFGKPDATYEEIKEASRLACADDFILQHPQGYKFKVGEGGNYLSGGQRQRLMLAQAFIKKADILIFDEPFSSLDQDTKKKVWNNIREFSKDKTTIIVSNVLDFISKADYLIILNNGNLEYQGEYGHLKNKEEFAKHLLDET